ncbi:lipid-A-disaccharide synthase [Chelativorans salis]|uniref:Lipid-A-disaccharide synthase n=1 Tax=Chelativorans salis TaxID=2978478 RepID=A0ABT2LM29_9HYPH|nr:lipid-A-disaccharide synthase [Chelativorans sp. EGI FJ00035]MCT7375635.1 lipid-A-disaccharide synthase [Chelativorans sp. EGI FJ00035]
MSRERPLRIAVVAGEESGDILGADLVAAIGRQTGRTVELTGVGGRNLEGLGLKSLFNADDIALMGISAVLRDLPRLMRRIGQAASAITAVKPDCLITIDSPDFGLRVAKRVRAADPSIPIVHYVCPSVWAWRPGRAAAMRPHVDHVLCLLPFEPDELRRLGGPPGTFVGHRLSNDENIQAAARAQDGKGGKGQGARKKLLLLPGSRKGEVRRLLGPFGETVAELTAAGHTFDVALPTVPHVAELVKTAAAGWPVRPEIILDQARKWAAFAEADAALACSGTVALELALSRVPFISCYKTDAVASRLAPFLLTVWSASLPNLIAGWPVVPEHFNEFVRPGYLARQLDQLWRDTPTRRAQREGFAEVAEALATPRPSGDMAAEIVIGQIERNSTR